MSKTAKIITLANQKGGVGKTTLCWALGDYLADKGKKILYLDLDPQRTLSQTLGVDCDDDESITLLDVLKGNIPIKNAIVETDFGDLLPGTIAGADTSLIKGNGVVKSIIEPVLGDYDYIIIDSPPQIGALQNNALVASDYVLIPTLPTGRCEEHLDDILSTIDAIREKQLNPGLKVLGIIVNMYDGRYSLHKAVLDGIREVADENGIRVLDPPIRASVGVSESARVGESPFKYQYSKRTNAVQDMKKLFNSVKEFK